jgi:hypothetical protein
MSLHQMASYQSLPQIKDDFKMIQYLWESGYNSPAYLSQYNSKEPSRCTSPTKQKPKKQVSFSDSSLYHDFSLNFEHKHISSSIQINDDGIGIKVKLDNGSHIVLRTLESAIQLLDPLYEKEAEKASKLLNTLDWWSHYEYENVLDEIAKTKALLQYVFNCPEISRYSISQSDDVFYADTLMSVIGKAYDEEFSYSCSTSESNESTKFQQRLSEDNNSNKPMQVHKRLTKPKREDALFNIRYKTQSCVHFDKHGHCPASENCHFAHGPSELRRPKQHPKFRTQICSNFLNKGSCQFQDSCFFKHELPK